MAVVMGTPFDRVQCPTPTLGTGAVVVTVPAPSWMRPYDAGVRDGDPVTLLLEEGNDFELVEATARNCTAASCEFTRDAVRYSSIGGVVSQASLALKGAARASIVAGAADLNVHRGGTIDGNIILNGDLAVSGTLTAPGFEGTPGPAGPQGPQGEQGQQGPQGPEGLQGQPGQQGPQGEQGQAGGSADLFEYTYSNSVSAPPAVRGMNLDNVNLKVATRLWVSDLEAAGGQNIANLLMLSGAGDKVYVQDKSDDSRYEIYGLTADPVNQGTYIEFPIVWERGGTTPLSTGQRALLGVTRAGIPGPQGSPGPQGPQGEAGPQGPQGAQGIQGAQGAAGTGITMKGSVPAEGDLPATAVQGDAYLVQADDSLWIYDGTQWVSGGSIQGPPGAQGAQGPQGLAGTPGPAGAQGPQGDIGPTGPQGPQGASGAPGQQGPAGPTAVSADAGNAARLGSDSKIFVPLKGVIDGSEPAAGQVGEYLIANNATGTALTTASPANVAQLTLTPGDWRVEGVVAFVQATNAVPTALLAGVSQASATIPTLTQVISGQGALTQINATITKGPLNQYMQTGMARLNVTANTPVYLVAQSTFSGGTLTAQGRISARRMR